MRVELYTMIWNEEKILPFFINFYRERFSDIEFYIADNCSTDDSAHIAQKLGCHVRKNFYPQMSNTVLNNNRNNVWKHSKADWVIVCDADECLDITSSHLENSRATLFMGEGYDMVGNTDDYNLLTDGVRNYLYDKTVLFKPSEITEINYTIGGHTCNPEGNVAYSDFHPKLFHFRYPNFNWVKERYESYCLRKSDEDKEKKYGGQYFWSADTLQEFWNWMLVNKQKVR